MGRDTGVLLRVHASNYAVVGFTAAPAESELAQLAHARGLPFVVDLGSGSLVDLARWGLPAEPTPMQALQAGADLVTFSGDKLLGGPQAGFIVGRAEWIKRIKRNPMKRALRCDKLRLAALEATLRAYLSPATVAQTLPAYRMIGRSLTEIDDLARAMLPHVEHWAGERARVEVVNGESQVGSGSLPEAALPTRLIALTPVTGDADELAHELRQLTPPVIGRVHGGKVLLDLRALLEPEALVSAFESAAK